MWATKQMVDSKEFAWWVAEFRLRDEESAQAGIAATVSGRLGD